MYTALTATLLGLGLQAVAAPNPGLQFSAEGTYDLEAAILAKRSGSFESIGSYTLLNLLVGGESIIGGIDTGSQLFVTPRSYDQSKSNAAQAIPNGHWHQCYGSGCISGPVDYDDITFPGGYVAKKQLIYECDFSCTGPHAIIGLDRNRYSYYNPKKGDNNTLSAEIDTLMGSLIKTLSQPLFAVDLRRADGNMAVDFGFINTTRYTSAPYYIASSDTSTGFWEGTLTGYSIAGGASDSSRSISYILDTGDPSFNLPQDIIDKYFAKVTGAKKQSDGTYSFPCSSALPAITLDTNGAKLVLNGYHLRTSSATTGTCYSYLQPGDSNGSQLWGQPFIEAYYVVFKYGGAADGSQDSVGFASKLQKQLPNGS